MLARSLRISKFLANSFKDNSLVNPLKLSSTLFIQPKKFYAKEGLILRNEKSGYFLNPEDVTRRFIKLLALHDKVKDPSKITLSTTFYELGINELNYVEIMLEAEQEFFFEFPDDDLEKFLTVGDVVEYVSRSFYAK